ncbi:hypothetical protein ZHAS_00007028 [Anopheles sinensis]|uniref:Uncharacterized protein n=1 Tax=Anopheles sinensis TaxID=74873 RepID=A0A084VNP7_ANOSI|nr:hypothetical protein ZHAS_00007028 [Anopheles sinensis]
MIEHSYIWCAILLAPILRLERLEYQSIKSTIRLHHRQSLGEGVHRREDESLQVVETKDSRCMIVCVCGARAFGNCSRFDSTRGARNSGKEPGK